MVLVRQIGVPKSPFCWLGPTRRPAQAVGQRFTQGFQFGCEKPSSWVLVFFWPKEFYLVLIDFIVRVKVIVVNFSPVKPENGGPCDHVI